MRGGEVAVGLRSLSNDHILGVSMVYALEEGWFYEQSK